VIGRRLPGAGEPDDLRALGLRLAILPLYFFRPGAPPPVATDFPRPPTFLDGTRPCATRRPGLVMRKAAVFR